jgi:RimJ/RimL family protein N-acetyltransferase
MTAALFETTRLRCRRWLQRDLEPLLAVYGDAEGMRWVDDGQPITRVECEAWLKVTEANYASRGYGMFALEELASGAVVGFCGLVHPGGQPEPEIKYAFLRSHWGRGLASEAVPALLAHGHARHRLSRIIATVAPANLASQRVLAKAGLRLACRRENEDGSSTLVLEWTV